MRLISKIAYLTKEGLKSIFSHGFMSFASISVMVACLIIMGSFMLLSVNIDSILTSAEDDYQILAYIDENLSPEDAAALKGNIEDIENVREAIFVTREVAFERLKERHGDNEYAIAEGIEADVLRHRYEIFLHDITEMASTKRYVEAVLGVDKVNAALEISQGFMTVRGVVRGVSWVLAVILVIVSVFMMANTVKLTTYGRREEIAIMKMVGATNGFIRWPFIVEGVTLGLVGSALSFLIQWGIYVLLFDRVMASTAGTLVTLVSFDIIKYQFMTIFLGIGVTVGVFGGSVAIRNYLRV